MPIFATAGSKLFIGGALDAKATPFVAGDFASQSWLEVAWAENLGSFGDDSAAIKFDAIGQNRVQKLKGIRDAGDMSVVCGLDSADPGQIAVRAAEETPNNYAFMVQFNDAPSSPGATPSARMFVAQVMTTREQLDTANNVVKMMMTLGVNSNIVKVPRNPNT